MTDVDCVLRCEALIDESRRGSVSHVETTARQWRADATRADNARSTGLPAHALGTCLPIQSRNAEAIAVLVDAAESARDHHDWDRYVRALVQSASALTDMGAHHRTLEPLADASRLSDQPISERARYVMHSVRAAIATQVRNFECGRTRRTRALSRSRRLASQFPIRGKDDEPASGDGYSELPLTVDN